MSPGICFLQKSRWQKAPEKSSWEKAAGIKFFGEHFQEKAPRI